MTTNRRHKRVRKFRGSRSHGWGKQKGHTKSGTRGGKGNAGRTSHTWIQVVKAQKDPKLKEPIIGKSGFKRPQEVLTKERVINVSHLNTSVDRMVVKGLVEVKDGVYNVDLSNKDMNYQKLLAQGEITKKMNITVAKASSRAIEKVEAAGGKVNIKAET